MFYCTKTQHAAGNGAAWARCAVETEARSRELYPQADVLAKYSGAVEVVPWFLGSPKKCCSHSRSAGCSAFQRYLEDYAQHLLQHIEFNVQAEIFESNGSEDGDADVGCPNPLGMEI